MSSRLEGRGKVADREILGGGVWEGVRFECP